MTSPDEPPPPPAPPPPAPERPIGGASSLGYGCAGFIGFFFAAAIAGTGFAWAGTTLGTVTATVVLLAIVVPIVRTLRGSDAHARAVTARVAVGFTIAAVVFGGCLVAISNADFR